MLVGAFASAWGLAALLALVFPLGMPATSARDTDDVLNATVKAASAEDLTRFLTSERWGISLAEIHRSQATEGTPGGVETSEIGFLGFVEREGRAKVLLRSEDGVVDQHEVGATLPDGRRLDSLGGTRLTLSGESTETEELLLFPEVTSSDDGDDASILTSEPLEEEALRTKEPRSR